MSERKAPTAEQVRRRRFVNYHNTRGVRFRVPVEPVAEHLDALCALMSQTEVAAAAQSRLSRNIRIGMGPLHQTTIGNIRRRTAATVQRDLAAAIMAVPIPETPSPGVKQYAPIGAHRRIQALVAAGFGLSSQDAYRGVSKSSTWNFLRRQDQIRSDTFLVVAEMYRELRHANPADHGVSDEAARRAKALALKNGWAPPGAWDDDTIDDPDAHAEWTGRCGTRTGYNIHLRERIPVAWCQPCRDARTAERRLLRERNSHAETVEAA